MFKAILTKLAASLLLEMGKQAVSGILSVPVFKRPIAETVEAFPRFEGLHRSLSRWCESEAFREILESLQAGHAKLTDEGLIQEFVETSEFFDDYQTDQSASLILSYFFQRLQVALYASQEGPAAAVNRSELRFQKVESGLQAIREEIQRFPIERSAVQDAGSVSPFLLPHQRNPLFTGREEILSALSGHLEGEKSGIVAVTGLGGVGKTQAVGEYIYRNRDQYRAVFWTTADSGDALLQGYLGIARTLGIASDQPGSAQEVIGKVRRWLSSNSKWLLVLENVENMGDLRDFLPSPQDGHVVITTRLHATGSVQKVTIEKMTVREGAEFLLRRAKIIGIQSPSSDAPERHQSLARELCEQLDGLPLALDQAGAFVEEVPSSLEQYLDLYRKEGAELRSRRGAAALDDHPSVTATFSLNFKQVEQQSGLAADIIRICAFLEPDSIPEEILTSGAAELGSLAEISDNALKFAEVIEVAGRYSLIDRNAAQRSIDIHHLVQEVVKDEMDEASRSLWARRVVRALARSLPKPPTYQGWSLIERLFPHLLAGTRLITEWSMENAESVVVLNAAGWWFENRGLYPEAKKYFQAALPIAVKVFGEKDGATLAIAHNLAGIHADLGDHSQAEQVYKSALKMQREKVGANGFETARTANNLATLYMAMKRYGEAQPLFEEAISLMEELGENQLELVAAYSNLATLHKHRANSALAKQSFARALSMAEKTLPDDHPDLGPLLNNLGTYAAEDGRLAEAKSHFTRAIRIREKFFDPDHPALVENLVNLAVICRKQGDLQDAKTLYERAIRIIETRQGAEHPSLVQVLGNFYTVLVDARLTVEASEIAQRIKTLERSDSNS